MADKIWLVRGETSGNLEGQPGGLTEWQFSDGPAGERGESSDYTSLLEGLRDHAGMEIDCEEADLTLEDISPRQLTPGTRFRLDGHPERVEYVTLKLPAGLTGSGTGLTDSYGGEHTAAVLQLTGEGRGRVSFMDLDCHVELLELG